VKATKKKRQVTYKGKIIKVTAGFSTQTLNTSHGKTIQALKESNCQPRQDYPAILSFLIAREIKTLHNKGKLKDLQPPRQLYRRHLKNFNI
jgi:hypothetical protein